MGMKFFASTVVIVSSMILTGCATQIEITQSYKDKINMSKDEAVALLNARINGLGEKEMEKEIEHFSGVYPPPYVTVTAFGSHVRQYNFAFRDVHTIKAEPPVIGIPPFVDIHYNLRILIYYGTDPKQVWKIDQLDWPDHELGTKHANEILSAFLTLCPNVH